MGGLLLYTHTKSVCRLKGDVVSPEIQAVLVCFWSSYDLQRHGPTQVGVSRTLYSQQIVRAYIHHHKGVALHEAHAVLARHKSLIAYHERDFCNQISLIPLLNGT